MRGTVVWKDSDFPDKTTHTLSGAHMPFLRDPWNNVVIVKIARGDVWEFPFDSVHG